MLLLSVLLLSCSKREFDKDADFTNGSTDAVWADNALLFTKIFRMNTAGDLLWFDIRNEIASFSKPSISLTFSDNGVGRFKKIDLRGRLYRYEQGTEELRFVNIPLDVFGTELNADLVFTFRRKQKEGCELITDVNSQQECERTYVLVLKGLDFTEPDLFVTPDNIAQYNGRTLLLSALSGELSGMN